LEFELVAVAAAAAADDAAYVDFQWTFLLFMLVACSSSSSVDVFIRLSAYRYIYIIYKKTLPIGLVASISDEAFGLVFRFDSYKCIACTVRSKVALVVVDLPFQAELIGFDLI